MSHMSPLLVLIMKVLRIASLSVAALMVVFLSLVLWQKTHQAGLAALTRADYTFMAVLLVLGLAALWMAQAIGREIRKSGA